ncbi:uncharacterized protein LOC115890463 [Sitophilus oryzae]|uniref:Uncharacterized protein LOC115890463 n=1 Tax=Sitophilus oryzae TaxID=7048 RepID=A0A6J2YTC1_SITOR|nr:uncharacterized protein LOC115890463 [Sitophilus oryzae]XP_030766563.1 uncharacterized protein LOC115890463 [Sitophilus oryzae]
MLQGLFESVKRHVCLWKVETNHKNNADKDASWRSVVRECGLSNVNEAKSMWTKLKASHRQAILKKISAVGEGDTRPWIYEKHMEFLLPYMKFRGRGVNVSITPRIIQSRSFQLGATNNVPAPNNVAFNNVVLNKRKIDECTSGNLEQEQKKKDQSKNKNVRETNVKKKEDTAVKKFFDSMCNITEDLPECLQVKVQRQIFNSVMEARETQLQMKNGSSKKAGSNQPECNLFLFPCSSESGVLINGETEMQSRRNAQKIFARSSSPDVQYYGESFPEKKREEPPDTFNYRTR